MKNRLIILAIIASFALVSLTAGCGAVRDIIDNEGGGNSVKGSIEGEVGKTYSTQWFDFKIRSIQRIAEYEGYTPGEDYTLLDVVIEETNTFGEDITMGTFDFYLTTDNASYDRYPLDPLDDSMMPIEFDLSDGERAEYHMLFEFPDDSTGVKLNYTEIDVDDNINATFSIAIPDQAPTPE
ncbi:MAG: hypothetical protein LBH17_00735 [Oscillospiraceae bacterium]|jgi:hypothetical protein|nr:hypothetical protein [Oscillospiraceae bacterium]